MTWQEQGVYFDTEYGDWWNEHKGLCSTHGESTGAGGNEVTYAVSLDANDDGHPGGLPEDPQERAFMELLQAVETFVAIMDCETEEALFNSMELDLLQSVLDFGLAYLHPDSSAYSRLAMKIVRNSPLKNA